MTDTTNLKCERCGHICKSKSGLKRHLQKKTPCLLTTSCLCGNMSEHNQSECRKLKEVEDGNLYIPPKLDEHKKQLMSLLVDKCCGMLYSMQEENEEVMIEQFNLCKEEAHKIYNEQLNETDRDIWIKTVENLDKILF